MPIVPIVNDYENLIYSKADMLKCKEALEPVSLTTIVPLIPFTNPYSRELRSIMDIAPNVYIRTKHDNVFCLLLNCNKEVILSRMRQHIGKHILNKDIPPNENTCGYCGMTGCRIELVKTSGKGIHATYGPASNCKYFKSFSLKAVEKSTKNSPCTNHPLECVICKTVYWSYNLNTHYSLHHPHLSHEIDADEKHRVTNFKF